MSRDVLAFSGRLVSVYIRRRDFYDREWHLKSDRVKCSKKTLFCGDCCKRNQAIILVVLVLVLVFFSFGLSFSLVLFWWS